MYVSVSVILGLVTKLKHCTIYKLILRFAEAKHTIIINFCLAVGALGTATLQNQGSNSYKIWHGPALGKNIS